MDVYHISFVVICNRTPIGITISGFKVLLAHELRGGKFYNISIMFGFKSFISNPMCIFTYLLRLTICYLAVFEHAITKKNVNVVMY